MIERGQLGLSDSRRAFRSWATAVGSCGKYKQRPNHDRHRDNQRSRSQDKRPTASRPCDAAPSRRRHLVRRKLHDERRRRPFQERLLQQQRDDDGRDRYRSRYIANSVSPCRVSRYFKPESPKNYTCGTNAPINSTYTGNRAEQLINGATRIVVSRSRRFSITRVAITPGIAQANDDSSGMNDLPLKPDANHQLVHQIRGPRHVAAIFQHRDEEKQDQNLRQKIDHASHAADQPFHQQRFQRPFRQRVASFQSNPAAICSPRRSSPSTAGPR